MAFLDRLRVLRARLRAMEASGVLEPGQEKDIAKGIRKVERGVKTRNHKMVVAGINQIVRALLK